ncbi:hypothetical protein [Streptomyces hydrogenans]|uniref:hypothetical protein n=1 Tax=Streptomyces hydrogenans TaxID=1873719 RepID=UPI00381180EC
MCAPCRAVLLALDLVASCDRTDGAYTGLSLAQAGKGGARTVITTKARRFLEAIGKRRPGASTPVTWKDITEAIGLARKFQATAARLGRGGTLAAAEGKAAKARAKAEAKGKSVTASREAGHDAGVKKLRKLTPLATT